MAKDRVTIQVDQGATLEFDFTPYDSDGTVMDLSGCAARMGVRPDYGLALTLAATTETGEIAIDAGAGVIFVRLSAEQTDRMRVAVRKAAYPNRADYLFDIDLTAPDGAVTRVLKGVFDVEARINEAENES